MKNKAYQFTLRNFWGRCRQEYIYFTSRPWTLRQVGAFWDTIEDYDDANESIYPHERRFSNSYELAARHLPGSDYVMLDIQTRSGKPTLFWHRKGKIKRAVCVDFSRKLLATAQQRLVAHGVPHECRLIDTFPLPFADKSFGLVCSYETVEHVYDYPLFIHELARVLEKDGIMVITCPNVAWEWVHWLSTAININHSEGPHRFLRRKELLKCFRESSLTVLEENTTIFLPFNHKTSIAIDQWLEKILPEPVKRCLGLRRSFVLRKG